MSGAVEAVTGRGIIENNSDGVCLTSLYYSNRCDYHDNDCLYLVRKT